MRNIKANAKLTMWNCYFAMELGWAYYLESLLILRNHFHMYRYVAADLETDIIVNVGDSKFHLHKVLVSSILLYMVSCTRTDNNWISPCHFLFHCDISRLLSFMPSMLNHFKLNDL